MNYETKNNTFVISEIEMEVLKTKMSDNFYLTQENLKLNNFWNNGKETNTGMITKYINGISHIASVNKTFVAEEIVDFVKDIQFNVEVNALAIKNEILKKQDKLIKLDGIIAKYTDGIQTKIKSIFSLMMSEDKNYVVKTRSEKVKKEIYELNEAYLGNNRMVFDPLMLSMLETNGGFLRNAIREEKEYYSQYLNKNTNDEFLESISGEKSFLKNMFAILTDLDNYTGSNKKNGLVITQRADFSRSVIGQEIISFIKENKAEFANINLRDKETLLVSMLSGLSNRNSIKIFTDAMNEMSLASESYTKGFDMSMKPTTKNNRRFAA